MAFDSGLAQLLLQNPAKEEEGLCMYYCLLEYKLESLANLKKCNCTQICLPTYWELPERLLLRNWIRVSGKLLNYKINAAQNTKLFKWCFLPRLPAPVYKTRQSNLTDVKQNQRNNMQIRSMGISLGAKEVSHQEQLARASKALSWGGNNPPTGQTNPIL